MQPTTLYVHSRFMIDRVDPRIFGGFLEHMGRAIYQGVYDPKSSQSDKNGFRRDVMAALRRQNMTVMRYPGGNFASGYHWIDGIGEKTARPLFANWLGKALNLMILVRTSSFIYAKS